jgi:hypothetical protein
MITVECIPYSSFKDKIRITKEIDKMVKPYLVEVFPNFIYVQKGDFNDRGL